MKRRNIEILAGIAVVTAFVSTAEAEIDLPDPGVVGQHRLVFVTSANPPADATVTMAELNTFVTDLAEAVTELAALGTTWSVVGATSTVDVFTNTNTEPGVDIDTPIYQVDGTLFAASLATFWSDDVTTIPKIPPGDQDWTLYVNEQGGAGGGNGTWAHTGLEAGPVTSANPLDAADGVIQHGGQDSGYNSMASPWYGGSGNWATGIDNGALFAISAVIGGGEAPPFEITEIVYAPDADPNPTVTLTWRSRSNTTYKAFYSLDLSDWSNELADSLGADDDENTDDGDHITVTFKLTDGLENEPDLFFRIEEEE